MSRLSPSSVAKPARLATSPASSVIVSGTLLSEAVSSPVRALDPVPHTVGVHHKAPNHLPSLHPHAVTLSLSMPPAGARARRRHVIMVIHHVMPPVRRRTASRLRRNLIQANGSHLRSLNLRDSITRGRPVALLIHMTLRCLTLSITSCLGNPHIPRPSLNLVTAPTAPVRDSRPRQRVQPFMTPCTRLPVMTCGLTPHLLLILDGLRSLLEFVVHLVYILCPDLSSHSFCVLSGDSLHQPRPSTGLLSTSRLPDPSHTQYPYMAPHPYTTPYSYSSPPPLVHRPSHLHANPKETGPTIITKPKSKLLCGAPLHTRLPAMI